WSCLSDRLVTIVPVNRTTSSLPLIAKWRRNVIPFVSRPTPNAFSAIITANSPVLTTFQRRLISISSVVREAVTQARLIFECRRLEAAHVFFAFLLVFLERAFAVRSAGGVRRTLRAGCRPT